MHLVPPADADYAATLFASLLPEHLSIVAVLEGAAEGQLLLDDPEQPALGLLTGPEGIYLAGRARNDRDQAALRAAIPAWAYLHVAPDWQGDLAASLPHPFMLPHPRRVFTIETGQMESEPVPDGFAVQRIERIGHRLLHEGNEVSHCLPDMIVGKRTEIGVWTDPAFRGRGLARIVARLTLAEASRQGIETAGWHCHASNRRSIALALTLGGRPGRGITAYSASLPGEMAGDIAPTEARAMALHFDKASRSIGWMAFHAAAAWAEAGEHDRALAALDALVGGGWEGEPEWLTGHWALAALRGHPRFEDAVERLRASR